MHVPVQCTLVAGQIYTNLVLLHSDNLHALKASEPAHRVSTLIWVTGPANLR